MMLENQGKFDEAEQLFAEARAQRNGASAMTHADTAAIERLVALGFDEGSAAEAYAACDRDEMAAANLLMDSLGSQPVVS